MKWGQSRNQVANDKIMSSGTINYIRSNSRPMFVKIPTKHAWVRCLLKRIRISIFHYSCLTARAFPHDEQSNNTTILNTNFTTEDKTDFAAIKGAADQPSLIAQ